MNAVAYCRVSTREQGRSGLGLEAQRAQIERFAEHDGLTIAEWYTEVQSGKLVSDTLKERPQLKAALAHAAALNAPVLIAKLDRLSRNVYFIAGLMEHGVEFVACDLGRQSDRFTLHLFAALAEKERELISKRTRDALKVLKLKGIKLGSKHPANGAKIAARNRTREAIERDLPALEAAGKGTLEDQAMRLNTAGFRTATGRLYTRGTVSRMRTRLRKFEI